MGPLRPSHAAPHQRRLARRLDFAETMPPLAKVQIEQSDMISFHNYGWPEEFEAQVKLLEQFHRPLICTEYMARGAGSTFDTILPIAQQHHVGGHQLGAGGGQEPDLPALGFMAATLRHEQPTVWFHDVFYADGTPLSPARSRHDPQPD